MSKVTHLTGGQHGTANQEQLHLRQIPGEAARPHESVGEDLRSERLRQGDELSRISRALRIRKDYLEAIESGDPDGLPGRTYAIGFLRSYAEYLGLDSPAFVSRYKQQIAGQAEAQPQVGAAPEPERPGFRLPWVILALGVAASGIYGFHQFFGSSDRPVAPPPLAAGQAVRPSLNPPRAGAQGTAAATAAPLAVPSASPDQQPIGGAQGQVFGAQNRDARVVLRARGLAHVLVQGFGGRVYINRLLHPGDAYRVPNLGGLSLTTQNGSAVSLELDGRDMGVAGRSGHMTEALSLDPRAIAGRKGSGSLYEGDKVTP
jgi:cytoskeleton protein RodZ